MNLDMGVVPMESHLFTFPRSSRTPLLDVVCDLDIGFNMDNSWMSWTLDIEIVLVILSNPILVGCGASSIGKIILSSFHAYVECPNLMWYASCTSI
jgi:hypothetical protein